MESLRQEVDCSVCTQVIGTDRIDDQVIKRIHADQRKQSENQIVENIKGKPSLLKSLWVKKEQVPLHRQNLTMERHPSILRLPEAGAADSRPCLSQFHYSVPHSMQEFPCADI